jgi:arylamine N-acetyltransferase
VTLFSARLNVRYANGEVERRTLAGHAEYRDVLHDAFGLDLSDADLARDGRTEGYEGRAASVFCVTLPGG